MNLIDLKNVHNWHIRRPLLPKRCFKTNELIWPMQRAYFGIIFEWSNAPLVKETKIWLSSKGMMICQLTGDIK